ncbi:MAG TPA: GNAT family N-acetyltransferase [Candidatus Saccharibacteria bacterium]|nr:GNAT family N-acetyltransferase [Candidatus Saccharibacteria bacterium]
MAFGPIMRFKVNDLDIELAPLTRESMGEFINLSHGGGMQRHSVTRYLGRHQAPTVEDEHEWFDRARAAKDTLVWGIWVIDDDNRALIGSSSLNGIGEDGQSGFIRQATSGSMIFRPEYWGKGIASTAHKARTWYAFRHLGLHRIKSAVIQGNGGSAKALSRSGYTFVYTERNELYSDGQLRHLDCFECLNPLDLFWRQWWHGDRPTTASQTARRLTEGVMAWAEENVTLA